MFDNKIISIVVILVFLLISCDESTKVEDPSSSAINTTSNPDLGHETANIQDYFYNFDEMYRDKYKLTEIAQDFLKNNDGVYPNGMIAPDPDADFHRL